MARVLRVGSQYVVPSGEVYAVPLPTVALSLTAGDLYEGNPAVYIVTLSKAWVDDVTVTYATSNGTASAGTDYTTTSGTLTIPAGQAASTVSAPTTLRSGAQASRTFTLTISNAEDAAGDSLTITTAAVQATILDTEVAPTYPTLSVAAVAAADEGETLTFRVTASFPFSEDITFSYATSNGTGTSGVDYTASSGTGTITAEALTTDLPVTTTLRSGYQGARTVVMTISAAETASEAPIDIETAAATGTIAETEAPSGDHGYFETLQADAAHYVSYSLRSQTEINTYTNGPAVNPWVTYDPGSDTDPQAQDAAKIVIPLVNPANNSTSITADIDASTTVIPVNTLGAWGGGRVMQMGSEYVILGSFTSSPRTYTVTRGALGTTPVAHVSGTKMLAGENSLINQVRLPLRADKDKAQAVGTQDGYTYLFTWDGYWTNSYLMPTTGFTHKCFQFSGKSSGETLLWEPRMRYDQAPNRATDLARVDTRMYLDPNGPSTYITPGGGNFMGPGVTSRDPLSPQAGNLTLKPGLWIRWFVRLEQRADNYDRMSMWVADENTAPVQIFNEIEIDVPANSTGVHTLKLFWLEYNTSVTTLRRDTLRDFVCYFRNFAVLRWTNGSAPDISSYLVQP